MKNTTYKILEIDPYLVPYEKAINLRMTNYKTKNALLHLVERF